MIEGLSLFARALRLTFSRRGLTGRRAAFVLGGLSIYSILRFFVFLGHVVDLVFFPSSRSQSIRSPIYIIAPPRSGTTFLHNLMCLDEERFTHFKTYETLFPAVSLYRLIARLSKLALMGGVARRADQWLACKAFGAWSDIHTVRLNQIEEDEGIFLYTCHTPVFYLLFPFVREFSHLQFSDTLDAKRRLRVMSYYRKCLQKRLFESGGDRTLLSKNVHSVGRVASLLETFPDARFVFILRHPYQAIPSLVSFYHSFWQTHSPEIGRKSSETLAIAQMGFDYYRYLVRLCQTLPAESFVCVHYSELVTDPQRSVAGIYSALDLTLNEAVSAKLREASRKSRAYTSAHKYSLEDFGLTKALVYEELTETFSFFGFPSDAEEGG